MSVYRCTWALALVAGLLGAVHVALAIMVYSNWTIDALWFVGTGLAILIAAAANVVGLPSPNRRSRILMITINLLMAGFFAAAWSILPGPQVIAGGVVFLALAGCSLANPFERKSLAPVS
jgi:hypothetical protein